MKTLLHRLMIVSGCLLIFVGIFFGDMPIEWFLQIQARSPSPTYLRVVPSDGSMSTPQIASLITGAILLIVGQLIRHKKSKH